VSGGAPRSGLAVVRLEPQSSPPRLDDLALEQGSWVAFLPAAARLHSDIGAIVQRHASGRPDVEIFYFDEVVAAAPGRQAKPIHKPSLNTPLLAADDYVGFGVAVRARALQALGGIQAGTGTAWLYDLLLRAVAAGIGVERVPQILMAHAREPARASRPDRRRALSAWLGRGPHRHEVRDGRTPATLEVRRVFAPHPEVTLVVPTMQSRREDGEPHVKALLESLGRSTWPEDRLRVLIGDDVEDSAIYEREWPFRLRRIVTTRPPGTPFHYARKMNGLWRLANTEHLVFLNDDVEVASADWLEALLTFAMDEDVGGVGARLLFPDGRVQHAGIVGGLFGACAHAWLGEPADRPTYQDWAVVHRDWSMVTGAVFATRKSVLHLINGFDENFRLEFNDLDMCLRLRALGYRIVCTPFAELIHHEKASRGGANPPGNELALFLKRWQPMLADDPAYSPGLRLDRFDVQPKPERGAWYEAE
jgi:O-antigen biosynthesis protein